MKKDLNYYLKLPYKIEIVHIPEDEGGGFMARLPQFGAMGIVGDGNTPEESLADLAVNQRDRFEQYLEKGLEIPEPVAETDDYSGRFVLRIPKFLHRELAQSARKNGVSLNQYACTLLSMNFQFDRLNATLNFMTEEIKNLNQCIGDFCYQFNHTLNRQFKKSENFCADQYSQAA